MGRSPQSRRFSSTLGTVKPPPHAVDAAKTEETAGEALIASKTHGFGTPERRAQDPLQIAHEASFDAGSLSSRARANAASISFSSWNLSRR